MLGVRRIRSPGPVPHPECMWFQFQLQRAGPQSNCCCFMLIRIFCLVCLEMHTICGRPRPPRTARSMQLRCERETNAFLDQTRGKIASVARWVVFERVDGTWKTSLGRPERISIVNLLSHIHNQCNMCVFVWTGVHMWSISCVCVYGMWLSVQRPFVNFKSFVYIFLKFAMFVSK